MCWLKKEREGGWNDDVCIFIVGPPISISAFQSDGRQSGVSAVNSHKRSEKERSGFKYCAGESSEGGHLFKTIAQRHIEAPINEAYREGERKKNILGPGRQMRRLRRLRSIAGVRKKESHAATSVMRRGGGNKAR